MDDGTAMVCVATDRLARNTVSDAGFGFPDQSWLPDPPKDSPLNERSTQPNAGGAPPADFDPPPDAPAADEAALRAAEPPAAAPTPAQIIEALLFASDSPLGLARLAELAGVGQTQARLCVADLNDKYAAAGLSFRIDEIARGYRMLTLPRFQPWLAKLDKQRAETRLSAAALETLAVVAYKQPLIRADIEAVRGVACGEVLNRLREMGLVKIVGRAEVVGRPMLYGTTKKFLDLFGLADLDDLPPMEALLLRKTALEAGGNGTNGANHNGAGHVNAPPSLPEPAAQP